MIRFNNFIINVKVEEIFLISIGLNSSVNAISLTHRKNFKKFTQKFTKIINLP